MKKLFLMVFVMAFVAMAADASKSMRQVSGTVTINGTPFENVMVACPNTGHTSFTDAEGKFIFKSLPADKELRLYFIKDGYVVVEKGYKLGWNIPANGKDASIKISMEKYQPKK